MSVLLDPFLDNPFLQRSLAVGVLVAIGCAVAGTFVVLRGIAFLGDALAHGILPGVAAAALAGLPGAVGAVAGAAVMVGGTTALTHTTRLQRDTAIGLLYVGMLSLGVVLVSRSRQLRGDLVGVLFGEVLGASNHDILVQAITTVVIVATAAVFHRPLTLVAYDTEQADVAGWSSRWVEVLTTVLVTGVVVMSFRSVGTLLVVGLLLAPAATGALIARSVAGMIGCGIVVGVVAVYAGLLLSFHAGLAAGASIVLVAVALFFVTLVVRSAVGRRSVAS